MNYPDSSTLSATAKKISFSSASRALTVVMGLALLLPGAAALATIDPIPDIDIVVKKNRPIINAPTGATKNGSTGLVHPFDDRIINAPTGPDGTYQFKGLAPGNYDLFVGGKLVQTLRVGDKGSISGVLSRDGGKASIAFNGQVVVVPDEFPGAPVITSRSNKKAGIAKAEEPPQDEFPGAPVSTTRSNKKAGIAKAEEPPRDEFPGAPVSTSRSNKPRNPRPSIAASQEPVDIRLVDASKVAVVPDLPGERAVPGRPSPSGPVGVVPDLPSERPAPGLPSPSSQAGIAKAGEAPLPGIASPGTPIVGIPVGLEGDPGSIKVSAKTDSTGAFHFDKLPAGKYKLTLPGLPSQSVTIGDDGIAGGKVRRGSDGSMSIFDRWGNSVASSPKDDGDKALVGVSTTRGTAPTPFSFGSGNTPGVGPGMSAGPGMVQGMSPGTGPAMGGLMSPGPSPMGGGPGGPGAGMRR